MRKLFGTLVVSGILAMPAVSLASGQTQNDHDQSNAHRYYDQNHKDYHNWDDKEDRAYRMWVADQHRKDVALDTLAPRDQAAYWTWRHAHSDAVLKINVQ